MSAKQSIHIEAPVEKVFDFCADPRKSWFVGPEKMGGELGEVKMTKDGVGTYYSWAMKVAGLRMEGFDVYTEYVPNQRFTDRSSASFAGTWTYEFQPEGSGTRLTMQRHPASFWAFGPVDRIVDRIVVTPLSRQTLEKTKEALETPTAAAAAPGSAPTGGSAA